MSAGITPVGGVDPILGPPAADRRPPAPDESFAADLDRAAAGPPPEVQAEVRAAARCAQRLHEMGRRLHFEPDPEGGRVRIEVRDLDGNVLRRIPPSEALEIAAGRREA